MDDETARRVWAAGAYAGLTAPKLAEKLGIGVDTLKRILQGKREWRATETEEGWLRTVAKVCGLPYSFFLLDFARLAEEEDLPKSELEAKLYAELLDSRRDMEALLKRLDPPNEGDSEIPVAPPPLPESEPTPVEQADSETSEAGPP